MQQWQDVHRLSEVSRNQYGFRRQRSICDALRLVRSITSETAEDGGFAILISLDIRSVFNSIPWVVIRRALRRKEFPDYIRRIIDSYLSDRVICCTGKEVKRDQWRLVCLRALYLVPSYGI
ncbi:reverse [Lasius niger]|uniref:Reverse n=1 Tax=Lasius niger TaxID=67767 RepID=A0A0J7KE34_LASNI|nr:reverse [Lasius niger]